MYRVGPNRQTKACFLPGSLEVPSFVLFLGEPQTPSSGVSRTDGPAPDTTRVSKPALSHSRGRIELERIGVSGNMLTTEVEWLEEYRSQVLRGFTPVLAGAADRLAEGERLLRRFNDAVDAVRCGSSFRVVDERHNELCIAKALVGNTKLRFPRWRTNLL
jgi:hypothetical protein